MTEVKSSKATTGATSRSDKAAQKLRDLKRAAMRLAVYVRILGAEPVALRGEDFRGWERELQRQYQRLRESLGTEAGRAARVQGRAQIRREGLSKAVADLLPGTTRTKQKVSCSKSVTDQPSEKPAAMSPPPDAHRGANEAVFTPNPLVCQRKYRHTNYLSAMLHARRIHSPGLDIYPCECGGLHLGHSPDSEHTKHARMIRKRLRSINRQLAAMEKQGAKLRRERQTLLFEQGTPTDGPPGSLRQALHRIQAWIAKAERCRRSK